MNRYCLAVIVLLVFAGAGAFSSKSAEKRCYKQEILVKCSGLRRETVMKLVVADGLDIWGVMSGGNVNFRVAKRKWQKMKQDFPGCEVAGNIGQMLKYAQIASSKGVTRNITQAEWFEEYHRYEELVTWYKELSEKYPDITKYVESIGESIEGKNIPAFHITASSNPKKFFFQCQIHAREWISGATCSYIADYLVTSYNNNERVTNLLNQVEFILVPIINPDGYEYTWTDDRLWRKNRRRVNGGICDGVDLNRNYPDHWNQGGSSGNPCSEIYHGEGPASEPETQASINYFKSQTSPSNPIIGAIDWHSYSQLLLRPYGWTSEDAPDEARLKELGDMISNAIYAVNGRRYVNQKSIGLYPTTGSADDWFYSDDANENNGEYRSASYTVELPDTGQYGFLLPPSQIIPTGQEVISGVLVFAESLLDFPLKKQ